MFSKTKKLRSIRGIQAHLRQMKPGLAYNILTQEYQLGNEPYTLERLCNKASCTPLSLATKEAAGITVKREGKQIIDPATIYPEINPNTLASVLIGMVDEAKAQLAQDDEPILPIINPVEEYLATLPENFPNKKQAHARLDALIRQIFGFDSAHFESLLIKRWLISAVARSFEAGCSARGVLLLVGPQNIGKTNFFRFLCPDEAWFDTLPSVLPDAELRRRLQPLWVAELGEIDAMFRAKDIAYIKSFISENCDSIRPLYSNSIRRHPRHCVFGASTNEDSPLTDSTGNSRYWAIKVDHICLDTVKAERDSLWDAAVTLYEKGEPWELTQAEGEQLERHLYGFESYSLNPHRDRLELLDGIMRRKNYQFAFTNGDLPKLLGVEKLSSKDLKSIKKHLEKLGFEYDRRRVPGDHETRLRLWVKPEWPDWKYDSNCIVQLAVEMSHKVANFRL